MNFITKQLKYIFWFPISSKPKVEVYQEKIRNLEWDCIKQYIEKESTFLDVGCGAGYSMKRAISDLQCNVYGVDPSPGSHGVGRYNKFDFHELPILKGTAENLPFESSNFDVVYCSHVLEHVNLEDRALEEMNRVMKKNGVLIIGMPTSTMSFVAFLSHFFFNFHVILYNAVNRYRFNRDFSLFRFLFIPKSHSYPNQKYIFYDLFHYRIKGWKKTVSKHFEITKIIKPGLYPYPDFIQWFPLIKRFNLTSSVFFICTKIKNK